MSDGTIEGDLGAVFEALRLRLGADAVLADRVEACWGPALAADDSAAARALRDAGAGWAWVALGFSDRSFWDLHVGILPVESSPSSYTVGLHWTSTVDDEVRPWAQIAVPQGTLQFAPMAGEHQLLCADADGITVHSAQSAVEAALEIASRVLRGSSGGGPRD